MKKIQTKWKEEKKNIMEQHQIALKKLKQELGATSEVLRSKLTAEHKLALKKALDALRQQMIKEKEKEMNKYEIEMKKKMAKEINEKLKSQET
jgi:hypothetical protein